MKTALEAIYASLVNAYQTSQKPAFIMGITGASGVGKTTLSNHIKKWLNIHHPQISVSVIQADNFIYPNQYLTKHHLMEKKGFPESFDWQGFQDFLLTIKGDPYHSTYRLPLYSQEIKDIHPTEKAVVEKSDIYIIEGINLFFRYPSDTGKYFEARDFINFCVYIDLESELIKQRAVNRFLNAYANFKKNKIHAAYFEPLAHYSDSEIKEYAEKLWHANDALLFQSYIEPYKNLADLIARDLPDLTK